MKKKLTRIITLLLLAATNLCTDAEGQQVIRVTAFVNINVIPMDCERVLTNQTVIVRDDKIVEIGNAAKIKIPPDAVRVDGRGQYRIPGLMI